MTDTFNFYPKSFLASILGLDAREIAVFTTVLMMDANGSPRLDIKTVAHICGLRPSAAQKIADRLVSLGHLTVDGERLKAPILNDWRAWSGRKPLPKTIRDAVMARDGERCAYCGATEGPFHIDHVHPIARGGSDDPGNLVVACAVCNLAKGSKTVEEWLQ